MSETIQNTGTTAKRRKSNKIVADNAEGVPLHLLPGVLGTGRTLAHQLVKSGQLESVKIGRSRIVTMRSIRRLLHGKAA